MYHTNEVQIVPYAREHYFLTSEYCIDKIPISNLTGMLTILAEGLLVCLHACVKERFCSVLQAYSAIVLKLGLDYFNPHHSQFIIHCHTVV